jgi:hypothetical protein
MQADPKCFMCGAPVQLKARERRVTHANHWKAHRVTHQTVHEVVDTFAFECIGCGAEYNAHRTGGAELLKEGD